MGALLKRNTASCLSISAPCEYLTYTIEESALAGGGAELYNEFDHEQVVQLYGRREWKAGNFLKTDVNFRQLEHWDSFKSLSGAI